MMITDEHFDVLREVREAAKDLQLACVEATGFGSFIHMAMDPEITPRLSEREAVSVQKLRLIK